MISNHLPIVFGTAATIAVAATGSVLVRAIPPATGTVASPIEAAHAASGPDESANAANAAPRGPAGSLALVLARDSSAIATDALDARIATEKDAIRANGATTDGLEKLGWSFVEKARVSGDHGYYLLAGHTARALRALDGASDAADLLEGHTLHSLHRFEEAEQIARRLAGRRGSPLDHALLGDALLDQGRLDEAIAAYEKMMQRRPDSRAYSRVAEVRLLTGDLDGALEAMRVASRAVSIRDREAFAWIWSRLAVLELQRGHMAEAAATSEAATSVAPGLATAELARGRVLLASCDAHGATLALERSIATSPLPDSMRALADAYASEGRNADAARITAELEAGGASVDPRGYSLWLSETGRDPARALWLARAELDRRRDVYTFDAVAMASAAAGNTEDAERYMREALAAGTDDPRLWYHAGIVAAAGGKAAEARERFLEARRGEHMLLPSLRRDLAARLDSSGGEGASAKPISAGGSGAVVQQHPLSPRS